jgi:hypothetical protein
MLVDSRRAYPPLPQRGVELSPAGRALPREAGPVTTLPAEPPAA